MYSLDLDLADDHDYIRDTPSLSYAQNRGDGLHAPLVKLVEHLVGQQKVEDLYFQLKEENTPVSQFYRRALEVADINVDINMDDLRRVPAEGPLVMVANHPFGVVDGLVLCDMAMRIRGEFKILIHSMLCQDRDFKDQFLPIDFDETQSATRNNIRTKKLAQNYLRDGGIMLIFPGGGVSTANRFGFGHNREAPWTTFAAKLIKQTGASVVPVFFHGQNSRLFHVASHLNINLRTGMLVAESRRMFGSSVKVEIGRTIDGEQLRAFSSRSDMTRYLYQQVMSLGLSNSGYNGP